MTAEGRQRLIGIEGQVVWFGPRHGLVGLDNQDSVRETIGEIRWHPDGARVLERGAVTDEDLINGLAGGSLDGRTIVDLGHP